MYKKYFRLQEYPFENTPDPRFYFNSHSHREALANMVYGVREAKGLILVTGDVGAGKTMLIQELKQELGEQHWVVETSTPWISADELLHTLRVRLEIKPPDEGEHSLIEALRDKLISLHGENRRVVLAVDEAHLLPDRTLEGIRLLSNLQTPQHKLIQIVLLGQEELLAKLARYSLRQLEQRIALRCTLMPLSPEETQDYIAFRLRVAGGSAMLFSPESLNLIVRESAGVPRRINLLCDNALLVTYTHSLNHVDTEVVTEVIASQRLPDETTPPPAAAAAPPGNLHPRPQTPPPRQAEHRPGYIPTHPEDAPPPRRSEARPPPRRSNPSPLPIPPPPPPKASSNPSLRSLLFVLLALALGAGGGGVGVWWLNQTASPAGSPDDGARRPVQQLPALLPEQHYQAPRESARTPIPETATQTVATVSIALDTPAHDALPVPFSAALMKATTNVQVSKPDDVLIAAARLYGLWNDTVEDIVLSANPELAVVDKLPPGVNVKLPLLAREQLIIQNKDGDYFIYYATFKDEVAGSAAVDTLKKVWSNAFLTTITQRGSKYYRIYLGSFGSRDTAENVVRALWLKYLPGVK